MPKLTTPNQILIFDKGDTVWTTSLDVAEKFDRTHKNVLQSINKLECSEEFSRLNFQPSTYKNDRGRNYQMFNMTRDGFTILAMGFTGKEAMAWKEKYITAFNKMEKELKRRQINQMNIYWQQQREQGKLTRHMQTDVIQKFVEYAQNQGSKSADKYYMNLTKMENKALFLLEEGLPKPNNLRDLLDTFQLLQLGTADKLVADTLEKGMKLGMPYKDIFQMAKREVEKLADIVGRTPIPSMIGHNSQAMLALH